jgi:hypothetical protein
MERSTSSNVSLDGLPSVKIILVLTAEAWLQDLKFQNGKHLLVGVEAEIGNSDLAPGC